MNSIIRSQIRELEHVKDFLESKSTRSEVTAKNYLTGLVHFNNFLSSVNSRYTVDTIVPPLKTEKENVYQILNRFVVYQSGLFSSAGTIKLNLEAVKSYLGHHDVNIIPTRFKRQVTLPKLPQEEETAIDANDVRKILLACNNRRLKTYLLILASGGVRAVEGLAIRLGDIDFSVTPTKIHIRAQFSKTRRARDIYISDEATKYLQNWIDWRYRENKRPRCKDDLIFHLWNLNERSNPRTLYFHISDEFVKLLDVLGAGFSERKEGIQKHKVTLKSFRSFVYTTISTVDYEYAEWFLGHSKSVYWRKKEPERREIYRNKCMKHLTFLDFTVLEARGRSIEANLLEKDHELQALKEQMDKMQQGFKSYDEIMKERMNKLDSDLKYYANEFIIYARKYGHPLSEKDRKAVEKFSEELKNIPDNDDIEE